MPDVRRPAQSSPGGGQTVLVGASAHQAPRIDRLMPEDEVLAMVGNGNLDFNDDDAVRRVARHFGVSQQALTIRLTALKLVVGGAANI
jgi:hypothetical protein